MTVVKSMHTNDLGELNKMLILEVAQLIFGLSDLVDTNVQSFLRKGLQYQAAARQPRKCILDS